MSRPKVYAWGSWRFEPHEYRLMHADQQVTLAMKSLDLLALLVARAPRLVTKEEILGAVWPDAAVEEGNIAFHVAALRKVLDEGAVESSIETVRGRGYRFTAAVVATPVIIPPSTPHLELPPEVKAMPIASPQRPWARIALLTALAMIVAGGVGVALFRVTSPAPILIAPFEVDDIVDASNAPSGSLTPLVVAALAETGVTAIEQDHGPAGETPRAAAARLGARLLLSSQMTVTAEKRWQVSLRLLRVDDGHAVWAWSFLAPYNERQRQLEEEIAKRVADRLKSYLTLSGGGPVRR